MATETSAEERRSFSAKDFKNIRELEEMWTFKRYFDFAENLFDMRKIDKGVCLNGFLELQYDYNTLKRVVSHYGSTDFTDKVKRLSDNLTLYNDYIIFLHEEQSAKNLGATLDTLKRLGEKSNSLLEEYEKLMGDIDLSAVLDRYKRQVQRYDANFILDGMTKPELVLIGESGIGVSKIYEPIRDEIIDYIKSIHERGSLTDSTENL